MIPARPLSKSGDDLPALTDRAGELREPVLRNFFAHQENFSRAPSSVGCNQVTGSAHDRDNLDNRFGGRGNARNFLAHGSEFPFGFYQFPKFDRVSTSFRLCKERLISFGETLFVSASDGCVKLLAAAWAELKLRVAGGFHDPL